MKTANGTIRRIAAILACAVAANVASAVDWYVDDANGDNGNDGRSAATAKKTIQAAVDRAANNDTVRVAPGVYSDSNVYGNTAVACVAITNKITLIATGRKEATHIVGQKAATSNGIGTGAVRCVYVKDGIEARIEGFTLRDGAVADSMHNGGGVCFSANANAAGWLVDCVVSNCVAYRGGAMQNGTAIRCRFSGNKSTSYGQVASQATLYNCLVVQNSGAERLFNHPRIIMNCTIADNPLNYFCYAESAHFIYNTIFLENANHAFQNGRAVLSNCLVSASISGFNQMASGQCATNSTGICFTAPALGNWRPRSDSGAAGLGDAAHLSLVTLPDESLRYIDYDGKPIPRSGPITCGAFQETGSVNSGTLTLDGAFAIDGFGVAASSRCNYLHSTNYPCMYAMKAVDATVSNIVWYSSTTGLPFRVPTLDGRVGVMPPPAGTMTLAPVYATSVVYADAENGDDDYAGSDIGSWDHPYKTLQAAIAATPVGSSSTFKKSVVCAKPGDYHEGGVVSGSIRRRIYIDGNRNVRVVALEGPEKTIVRGESAADAADGVPCACIYLNAQSLVQGFTITDGHTAESGVEGTSTSGSAFACALGVKNRIIADCIISNNVAMYSAQRSGLSVRCTFLDHCATAAGGGDLRSGYAVNDVFRTSSASSGDAYTIGTGSQTFFSTYSGKIHSGALATSRLAMDAGNRFVDASADDYRLISDSPAFGAGDDDPESYWQYANIDLDGNLLYAVGGRPTAGAHQMPSAMAMAVSPAGLIVVDGAPTLTNAVLAGASVTVSKAESCRRNLLGFTLPDGTFSKTQTYTYVAPATPQPASTDVISAVFSTNWYVNAGALGSDSNDGFTAATPKKTLAGVMAAVVSGDTVHAAPGEYADGVMQNLDESGKPGGNPVIRSRVVIPKGVTLVSDGGADLTHIVGASASAQYDVQLGLGSNAVRCVFISTGARLKGFTLRGGRTNADAVTEDGSSGAGVLGVSCYDSFVEDCVISNCTAAYGGAGYGADFKRCRFFHNRATERSSVTRISSHDTCVADWNWGARPFDYFSLMTNCTIGAHQIDENGNVGNGYCLMQPTDERKTLVIDCLVLGRIHNQVKMRRTAALATSGVLAANCEDCILTNLAALVVDDDYRPVIGKNAAIDVIPLASEDESVRNAKDAYGEQRVYNGARDLGARDADWRPHYAKTLGSRRITVTAADPAVVEVAGAVRIPDGSVDLVWRTPEANAILHSMNLAVSGGGALSVEKDSAPFAVVSEATSGVRTFIASGSVAMSFSYAADGGVSGYAELSAFSVPIGFMLLVR